MKTLIYKYSKLFKVFIFATFIFATLFFSQKYMAMTSETCCSIGYMQKQYFYTKSFMVSQNGNILANGSYWQPSSGWTYYFLGRFLANSTLGTMQLASVPSDQYSLQSYTDNTYKDIWEDASGNIYTIVNDTLNKFDSNLNLVTGAALPLRLNYTPSGFPASYDSVAFDGNGFMYILGTKMLAGVSDGYLYLAKYDLNTMTPVGVPVQVMAFSSVFSSNYYGIKGLEYSPTDNSLAVVYPTNWATYSIQKYVANFPMGTYSTVFGTPQVLSTNGANTFEIDQQGDILVSTYNNQVNVYNSDMTFNAVKSANFSGVTAYKIESNSDTSDNLYFLNSFGINVFMPPTQLTVSGITSGQTLTQGAAPVTMTLKLDKEPASPVYINITPDGSSNIVIDSGSGFANSTQVMFDTTNWNVGISVQVKYLGGVNDKTLENIVFAVDTTKTTLPQKCIETINQALVVDKQNVLTDPAINQKVVSFDGTYIVWKIDVVNPVEITTPVSSLEYIISDVVPANTSYVQGSLICTAKGISISNSCYYDIVQNKVVWIGNLAANGAVTTASGAGNEVTITFKTTVPTASMSLSNQSNACKDTNLDGMINTEDYCILSDDPTTISLGDPTVYSYTFTNSSSSSSSSSAPTCATQTYNISGNVYLDSNKSAVKDASETGISAVEIKLLNDNGNLVLTTTSDQNGNYNFAGVQTGNYKLVITPLSNYSQTTSTTISLVIIGDVVNQNFGQVKGLATTGAEIFYLKFLDFVLK